MFSANRDAEYKWRARDRRVRMKNLQRLPSRKSRQKHKIQKIAEAPRPVTKKTEGSRRQLSCYCGRLIF